MVASWRMARGHLYPAEALAIDVLRMLLLSIDAGFRGRELWAFVADRLNNVEVAFAVTYLRLQRCIEFEPNRNFWALTSVFKFGSLLHYAMPE